jgi:xanthine/uracil/vitamin C permease (AzgA family)
MFGILSYVILKVLEGGAKEIKPVMWISFGLFLVYLYISM